MRSTLGKALSLFIDSINLLEQQKRYKTFFGKGLFPYHTKKYIDYKINTDL